MSKSEKIILCCSFCGQSQFKVERLIAGPQVFICNDCIGLCVEIIEEERSKEMAKGSKIQELENRLRKLEAKSE